MRAIADIAKDLETGRVTSRALTEDALARIEDPDGEPVIDGLQVSASRTTLKRLCAEHRGRFHCFSGYAGWGAGQLEHEIGKGTWLVCSADVKAVLDVDPDQMWNHCLRHLGIDPVALVGGGGQA